MAVIPLMPGEGFALLARNISEARRVGMPRNMATPPVYLWFYLKVRNHGPWDYKQMNPVWANFGNFNYGATGTAAGIPANVLYRGGGFAQNRAKTSKKEWGHQYEQIPYGDDPRDQYWIKQGIDYANQHGYQVTSLGGNDHISFDCRSDGLCLVSGFSSAR